VPEGVVTTVTSGLSGYQNLQLTFDPTSSALYVVCQNSRTVEKVAISSGTITRLAGSSYGTTDSTGTSSLFNWPEGIAMAGQYIYVADYNGNTIRMLTNSGTYPTVTLAGVYSIYDSFTDYMN